jgi:restriction system protein
MQDTYDELMQPIYVRLSSPASPEQAHVPAEDPLAVAVEPIDATASENVLATLHRQATIALKAELLAHIYAQDHAFFESLIIDVLLAMGYGSRRRDLSRRLGRSHDGGIDGVISQDELGLDVILIQAKRLKPNSTVSASSVRDFVGSLEAHRAQKGVFVTTGQFSQQAKAAASQVSRRMVLINGSDLTGLMIRHNIGVSVKESYVFKSVAASYFSASPNAVSVSTSDSNQFLR